MLYSCAFYDSQLLACIMSQLTLHILPCCITVWCKFGCTGCCDKDLLSWRWHGCPAYLRNSLAHFSFSDVLIFFFFPLPPSLSLSLSLSLILYEIYICIYNIFFLSLQTFYRQCLHDNAPPTTPSTTTAAVNITHPTPAPPDSNLQSAPIVRRDVNGSAVVSSPFSADDASPLAAAEDVAESLRSTCELPLSYVSDNVLPALWRVIYWTSQVLTW